MAPQQVADELIDALKKGLGSRLACSLPLPDYTAGEVNFFLQNTMRCTKQINQCASAWVFNMSWRKHYLPLKGGAFLYMS